MGTTTETVNDETWRVTTAPGGVIIREMVREALNPTWSDPDLDPAYWWIDVGPFMDRFGASALAITSSTDAQVRGLVQLIMPRKYIDLKRADLPAMLDLLVSKGLITGADKTAVLTTPTTEYERHVKGLVQPT